MKLFGSLLFAAMFLVSGLDAQVRFKLELLPDNTTYRISMASEVTWTFPQNLTSSAQITIRVPHAEAPYGFIMGNLVSIQPGTEWDDNVRINAPVEAPEWDYISFSLISGATAAFSYTANEEIPLFEFNNAAESCLGTIEIIDNQSDPFLPPNSVSANIPNAIVTLGGGLMNAYMGNIGNATEPCLPVPSCTVFGSTTVLALCEGEAYNGLAIQQDTLLQMHYLSEVGCDSIVSVQVDVVQPVTTTTNISLCAGSVYQGVVIAQDTSLSQVLVGSAGCDSTAVVQIEVVSFFQENLSVQLCQGQSYGGVTIEQDTSLSFLFTTAAGCDSLLVVDVDVVNSLTTQLELGFCIGTIYNGNPILGDTTYAATYTASGGCDSVVTTHITAWPLPLPVISVIKDGCDDRLFAGDFETYQWNNGAAQAELVPAVIALYVVTVSNAFGCEATATYDYQGALPLHAAVHIEQPDCTGGGPGRIEFVDAGGGAQPYLFSINGGQTFFQQAFFDELAAGVYTPVVEDVNGCRWESPAVEIGEELLLVLHGDENRRIHLGENTLLEFETNMPFDSAYWQPATGLACAGCQKTLAAPLETTRYRLTVVGSNGCTEEASVWVVVDENVRAYIPDAFSPNDDGLNDYFTVFAAPEVEMIKTMKIFDRQGGLVFSRDGFLPNDPALGWSGEAHGKQVGGGAYTYYIELALITGRIVQFAADVTVVK